MAMGWRVTNQRAQDELTPSGDFQPVWVITYVTDPEGVVGTVKIPSRLYTAEYVQEQIEQQVSVNKAVHNL